MSVHISVLMGIYHVSLSMNLSIRLRNWSYSIIMLFWFVWGGGMDWLKWWQTLISSTLKFFYLEKNVVISISANSAHTILNTIFIDYGGMAYIVLKNIFKQTSIFTLICSMDTGDGSHDANTHNYSVRTCVDNREYIFLAFLVLFIHYVLLVWITCNDITLLLEINASCALK